MLEILIIAVIVAAAAYYTYLKLAPSFRGREACCEDGDDCSFKEFIAKEGNVEKLKCSGPQVEKVIAQRREKLRED